MAANIVRFLLVVLQALLAGTMFGISVGYNPADLSPGAYVEQQQIAIGSLNTLLPVMGAVCIVLAITLAVLSKDDPHCRYLLVGAVLLMVVAAVVTRFENQPINAVVMQWSPQSPGTNWAQLRDQWWQWHLVRTIAAVGAMALTVLAVLVAKVQRARSAA
jgi:uncharacterized membrane protein